MLSKSERGQIKQILQAPQWSAIDLLIKKLIEKAKDDYGARETEWETIRHNLITEGKIRGLVEFTQQLMNEAQHNEQ